MRTITLSEDELSTLAKAFDAGTRAIVAESGIAALHQLQTVLSRLEASEEVPDESHPANPAPKVKG